MPGEPRTAGRVALCLLLWLGLGTIGLASELAPLTFESTIPLGQVSGRIDHLAIDLSRQRLYVAELGNDSVGVVDLKTNKLLRTIVGLNAPQGLAFVPATDDLYVASGGDGAVHIFHGPDLTPAGVIALGDDADNLRLAPSGRYVLAGYGSGGIALIDPVRHAKTADIALRAHPEGFQVSGDDRQVLVNVPDKQEIAVVDLAALRQTASWPTANLRANFPMSLDESAGGLWVAFRNPARLAWFELATGTIKATLETCSDSDDIFADSRRHRIYVICGSGHIDVWERRASGYVRIARLETTAGARTGLFVSELDRLYVATRASSAVAAAVFVYRLNAADN